MKWISESSLKKLLAACAAVALGSSSTFGQGAAGTAAIEFTHSRYTTRPNAATASVTLRRAGHTNDAVAVDFATADQTAIAGNDYTEKRGPINFSPGQTETNIGN